MTTNPGNPATLSYPLRLSPFAPPLSLSFSQQLSTTLSHSRSCTLDSVLVYPRIGDSLSGPSVETLFPVPTLRLPLSLSLYSTVTPIPVAPRGFYVRVFSPGSLSPSPSLSPCTSTTCTPLLRVYMRDSADCRSVHPPPPFLSPAAAHRRPPCPPGSLRGWRQPALSATSRSRSELEDTPDTKIRGLGDFEYDDDDEEIEVPRAS